MPPLPKRTTASSLFRSSNSTILTTNPNPPPPPAPRLPLPHHNHRHHYHSYETAPPPPYPEPEAAILRAALTTHVPSLGFTQTALRRGAVDTGYLAATTNLFPRGEFELVLFHLRMQRLGLGFGRREGGEGEGGVGRRVRELVLRRLRGNIEAGVLAHWQQALGIMSLAGNIPTSLHELFLLSDEIWFLAGDKAVDTSWYTKRASLASVFAATEVFQTTTDQSSGFRDTEQFLDRRLEEVRVVGGAWRDVREWSAFQGMATVNLARSWGVRI